MLLGEYEKAGLHATKLVSWMMKSGDLAIGTSGDLGPQVLLFASPVS